MDYEYLGDAILDKQTNLPIRKYLIEYYQDNKRHTTWFYASRIGDILKDVAEIKGKILNSQYATKKDFLNYCRNIDK